jgi:cellobiose-specific phosphotransferase system component IIC
MQEGNHRDLILQMTTRIQTQTMKANVVRTSVGRSTLRGADAHREVGQETEMMMMETGTGMTLMIVITVSSVV